MSSTYTHSQAETFTITNAKYLASKVQTDLMRLHRFYYSSHGSPTLTDIEKYYNELVLLQVYNFLDEIEYGFTVDGTWVKALKYTARQGGVLTSDEDPGGIRHGYVPSNASFSSFLRYNSRWHSFLSDKQAFLDRTPIQRTTGSGFNGNWQQQRAYSSGGRGLLRSGI